MKDTKTQNNGSAPVVLITGGARRVGKAMAERLHAQGYHIIIHYNRSSEEAEALCKTLNARSPDSAHTVKANLNSHGEVIQLASDSENVWGRIDALINNASTFYQTPLGGVTPKEWDDLFASNCKAPFFLSQALLPALKKNKGTIINILDIFSERPMPQHTVYCMAKSANRMLTQSLALECAPDIRVNGIAPGAIMWPEDKDGNEMIDSDKLAPIPLKKLGGAEAIATAAQYLLTQADYVTGQILNVDGGRSLNQ